MSSERFSPKKMSDGFYYVLDNQTNKLVAKEYGKDNTLKAIRKKTVVGVARLIVELEEAVKLSEEN